MGDDNVVVNVCIFFFFQAEDGIRDYKVTGVQTCALPISHPAAVSGPVRRRDGRLERYPARGLRGARPRRRRRGAFRRLLGARAGAVGRRGRGRAGPGGGGRGDDARGGARRAAARVGRRGESETACVAHGGPEQVMKTRNAEVGTRNGTATWVRRCVPRSTFRVPR